MSAVEPYYHPFTEWSTDRTTYREYLVCPVCTARFADSADAELEARLAAHLGTHTVVEVLDQLRRQVGEHHRVINSVKSQLRTMERSL